MKARYGYRGIHLFDRSSGLNILLDEVSVPNEKWSVAPCYMSFALTNACELSCSYCYAPKTPARLKSSNILKWAGELEAAGCFGIGFGGGEPTLYPGFTDLCRDLHSETRLAITMTTHGHRFSSSLVNQLSGNIDFIRLSMDGIGPTYERLRGRSFEDFKHKLALIKSTSRFGINFVVNKDTISDLSSAAEFAFKNGAEEFLLLPEIMSDGEVALFPEQIDHLSKWVLGNYQQCRIAISEHGVDCIDAPILLPQNKDFGSFDFMHVDAFARLKMSAFSSTGISIDRDASILHFIKKLRDDMRLEDAQ